MKVIERRQEGDVHIWSLDGGIDRTTHDEFVEHMERALEAGERKVVLDLGRVTYLASMGIGTLLRVHKRFAKVGGELKFANLHTVVGEVLRVTHLDRIFDVYPTVADAVGDFD